MKMFALFGFKALFRLRLLAMYPTFGLPTRFIRSQSDRLFRKRPKVARCAFLIQKLGQVTLPQSRPNTLAWMLERKKTMLPNRQTSSIIVQLIAGSHCAVASLALSMRTAQCACDCGSLLTKQCSVINYPIQRLIITRASLCGGDPIADCADHWSLVKRWLRDENRWWIAKVCSFLRLLATVFTWTGFWMDFRKVF